MSPINSSLSLQGKVAIVTGASRGIGARLALELATRGAKVVITYTSSSSDERAEELVSKIKALKNGSTAIKVRSDLRQIESPEQIVEATRSAFGDHIDILVNNAGTGHIKTITETTVEDYASLFDLNVRGLFLMTKAVVPHLRAPGRIINIGSIGGSIGTAGFSTYSATKGAVGGLTRSWAAELGPAGHSVNSVNPGVVITELVDILPPGFLEGQNALTPMENRSGSVDDIAQIVGFLAEDGSRWITGQSISATGGQYMN
ncbi:hypothetical protein MMC07_006634 [Pseudocyphellaria aurata]|nr:hypothetical protein [Pseudocyphellaria aurata]